MLELIYVTQYLLFHSTDRKTKQRENIRSLQNWGLWKKCFCESRLLLTEQTAETRSIISQTNKDQTKDPRNKGGLVQPDTLLILSSTIQALKKLQATAFFCFPGICSMLSRLKHWRALQEAKQRFAFKRNTWRGELGYDGGYGKKKGGKNATSHLCFWMLGVWLTVKGFPLAMLLSPTYRSAVEQSFRSLPHRLEVPSSSSSSSRRGGPKSLHVRNKEVISEQKTELCWRGFSLEICKSALLTH